MNSHINRKMDQQKIKEHLGSKAAELIQNNMVVGLGSGSTSECFIHSLIAKTKREALAITVVSSSEQSTSIAKRGGLKVFDLDKTDLIDITVDGADEIAPNNALIKGGGGAHTREKILAAASTKLLIIADESKLVNRLGKTRDLPVEILSYGAKATENKILKKGLHGQFRLDTSGNRYVTDNGNYLFDIEGKLLSDPRKLEKELLMIPGVVDTGFFFDMASHIWIGKQNGSVEELF